MEPATILLVEDDPASRETMAAMLVDAGYRVTTADGRHAALQAHVLQPDAILLDLYMQPVDGETAYHQLDADPLTRDIPVMLTSAVPDVGVVAERLHATSSLRKPFTLKLFIHEVASLVEARRAYLVEHPQ